MGTLMGAVRGGKFIPDDTDADIMVDERHWDRFIGALIDLDKHTRVWIATMGTGWHSRDFNDASAMKQVFSDPDEHFARLHVSFANRVHVDIYRYRVCASRPARTHTAYGSTHKYKHESTHTHTHTHTQKYTDTDVLCAHAPEQHHRC